MQLTERHLVNRIHKCTRTYTHVRTRSVEPFCRRANINITSCRPPRNENVVKHKINDFHMLLNIYLLTVSSDSSSKDIRFCVIFRVTCKLIICIVLFEQLTKKVTRCCQSQFTTCWQTGSMFPLILERTNSIRDSNVGW